MKVNTLIALVGVSQAVRFIADAASYENGSLAEMQMEMKGYEPAQTLAEAPADNNAVKPMNHYLNNPNAVPQAVPGQWPIGKSTDKWGVTTTYGRKDDGTDDHTVLNMQTSGPGVRFVQGDNDAVKPMEHYLNNPMAVPAAVPGQWPVGQTTDKWGVTHKYGTKDDGTDDHTVLNFAEPKPARSVADLGIDMDSI